MAMESLIEARGAKSLAEALPRLRELSLEPTFFEADEAAWRRLRTQPSCFEFDFVSWQSLSARDWEIEHEGPAAAPALDLSVMHRAPEGLSLNFKQLLPPAVGVEGIRSFQISQVIELDPIMFQGLGTIKTLKMVEILPWERECICGSEMSLDDLADFLPTIERLEVSEGMGAQLPAKLPETLKALVLNPVKFKSQEVVWPPGLESLELSFSSESDHYEDFSYDFPAFLLDSLPATLKQLSIESDADWSPRQSPPLRFVGDWPSSLEYFECGLNFVSDNPLPAKCK